jgi:hypothetical protein
VPISPRCLSKVLICGYCEQRWIRLQARTLTGVPVAGSRGRSPRRAPLIHSPPRPTARREPPGTSNHTGTLCADWYRVLERAAPDARLEDQADVGQRAAHHELAALLRQKVDQDRLEHLGRTQQRDSRHIPSSRRSSRRGGAILGALREL